MLVYLILFVITIVWLSIILIAPLLVHFAGANVLIVKIYYFLFRFICHQKPERSYFLMGDQLPVCARCMGIYAGLLIGLIVYPCFKKIDSTKVPSLKQLWIFVLPILIDGLAQSVGLYTTSNMFRSLTGIWFSSGVIYFLLPVLNDIKKSYK